MATYRDEREAALAQNEALQKSVSSLESEKAGLAQQNDALRRENAELRAIAGVAPPQRSKPGPVLIVVIAVMVLACTSAMAFLVYARAPSSSVAPRAAPVYQTSQPVPSAVPVQVSETPPAPSARDLPLPPTSAAPELNAPEAPRPPPTPRPSGPTTYRAPLPT